LKNLEVLINLSRKKERKKERKKKTIKLHSTYRSTMGYKTSVVYFSTTLAAIGMSTLLPHAHAKSILLRPGQDNSTVVDDIDQVS
jgi:hypothetical protein